MEIRNIGIWIQEILFVLGSSYGFELGNYYFESATGKDSFTSVGELYCITALKETENNASGEE